MRHVNGVDMSTGSLGQGLSVAVGMALAGKLDKKDYRVYAVMGDGEIEEGQIWEAGMAAAKYAGQSLRRHRRQRPADRRFHLRRHAHRSRLIKSGKAFGWNVIKIDGHDYCAISDAFDAAAACKGKPTMILAKTVKGKGVSYMENNAGWHARRPTTSSMRSAARNWKRP